MQEVRRAADGGVQVDENMCSSVSDVYAGGDCCTVNWPTQCHHWFQMRLWTQVCTLLACLHATVYVTVTAYVTVGPGGRPTHEHT